VGPQASDLAPAGTFESDYCPCEKTYAEADNHINLG